jgi:hypothetical protein
MTTGGYIEWESGDTLDAEDAMTYLMQQSVTIWVDAAARDVAGPYKDSLVQGNLSFTQSDGKLYYYTGTVWEPIASEDYVDAESLTIQDMFVMVYMETI